MLRLFLLSAIVNCVLGENVKWKPWALVPDTDHILKEIQHWLGASFYMSLYDARHRPDWGDFLAMAAARLENDYAHIASVGQAADPSVKKYFDEITAKLNQDPASLKKHPTFAILRTYREAYMVLKRQLESLNRGGLIPIKYLETVWHVLWGVDSFSGAPIEMWYQKQGLDSRQIKDLIEISAGFEPLYDG